MASFHAVVFLNLPDDGDALNQFINEWIFKVDFFRSEIKVKKRFYLFAFAQLLVVLQLFVFDLQLFQDGIPCVAVLAAVLADIHACEVKSENAYFEYDVVEEVEKQSTVIFHN